MHSHVFVYICLKKTNFPREESTENFGELEAECFCLCRAIKDIIMQGFVGKGMVTATENYES